MATSRVMASRSPPNPDHPRHPIDQSRGGLGSMNVDDILRSIYSDSSDTFSSSSKSVEEVMWRESGRMTLEDFLAKAGAVDEQQQHASIGGAFGMDQSAAVQFGMSNGGVFGVVGVSGGGNGRGKRRAAVEEAQLDKAAQQKQRRMIKNRESAARSRERKQAYTFELEALVTQLEEDNARLVKEQAELNKERYKQLMKSLIPVIEKQRPHRVGRTRSMEW